VQETDIEVYTQNTWSPLQYIVTERVCRVLSEGGGYYKLLTLNELR